VLKKILPPFTFTAIVAEPSTEQFVIVLEVAPPMNLIVLVPLAAETVVLEIIKALPPVFNPSNVTLSAPLRSIKGFPAVVLPEIVRVAPPVGEIVILVQEPAPSVAVFVPSFVSPVIDMVIVPVAEAIAVKASRRVVYVPLPTEAPATITCAQPRTCIINIPQKNTKKYFLEKILSSCFIIIKYKI
jgi:hypothetical protein